MREQNEQQAGEQPVDTTSQVNVSFGTHIIEQLRHINGTRHADEHNGYDARPPHKVVHQVVADVIADNGVALWRAAQGERQ